MSPKKFEELHKIPMSMSTHKDTLEMYRALSTKRKEAARNAFERAVEEEYIREMPINLRGIGESIRDSLDQMFEDTSILSYSNQSPSGVTFEKTEVWLDFTEYADNIVIPRSERYEDRYEIYIISKIHEAVEIAGIEESYYLFAQEGEKAIEILVTFDRFVEILDDGSVRARFIANQIV